MRLQCIWLARSIPFPPASGDRVYAIGLLRALVRYADVRYLGIGDPAAVHLAQDELPAVQWIGIETSLKSRVTALLNGRPYVSARHSPPLMVARVRRALSATEYDFVLLDQYGLGWALEKCGDIFAAKQRPIVYLSHNHEAALAQATAKEFRGNIIKRVLLKLNAVKIAKMELLLVRAADVVTAISADDASALACLNPKRRPIVLAPGMDAGSCRDCSITEDTPRKIVMVGSLQWVTKQINLRHFLSAADEIARKRKVQLDIIGDVPMHMAKELESKYAWVHFLGFVERLEPLMASYRLALNIENTGGGFKLKILTYVAAGLPIVALSQSLTGVPCELKKCMVVRDTGPDLLAAAIDAMEDVSELRQRAATAKQCVERLFSWDYSAQQLVNAVTDTIKRPGHSTAMRGA